MISFIQDVRLPVPGRTVDTIPEDAAAAQLWKGNVLLLDRIDDPICLWQYGERYLGVGTRTYSSFSADLEMSAQYHPQRGARSFLLPSFWVPKGRGTYLVGALESSMHTLYRHGESFLLPVHPDIVELPGLHDRDELLRCEVGPPIEVVPSANGRTVFVEKIDGRPVQAHFLKLHYPRRLSRFTRRLRNPIIGLQLWVAAELARIGVPFLPEVGGGVFGTDPYESWGFVIRETKANSLPLSDFTVPLFALYGRDYHRRDDPTLLEQLVESSGEDACSYLERRIVRPMVRLWLDILLRTGCVAEMHGQNALFGLSADRSVSQILYRDCAVYVDPTIRSAQGAPGDMPPVNVISRDVRVPRAQVFSLAYDSFMGNHALAYIARLADERFGVEPSCLHAAAKAEFASRPGTVGLLPDSVHYYDGELHPDGAWRLVDTGRPPEWR